MFLTSSETTSQLLLCRVQDKNRKNKIKKYKTKTLFCFVSYRKKLNNAYPNTNGVKFSQIVFQVFQARFPSLTYLQARMSTPTFTFATVTRTHTSAPAAAEATSAAAAPAPPGPITQWPAWMLAATRQTAAQQEFSDDYEMKMSDINESDRNRFRLESQGRSYAAHWPYDRELDVWRRIFLSYPETVQMGLSPADPHHNSGVFWRDIKRAREDIEMLRTMPAHPPVLQRANADPGY
jgi:hypothetical protein